METVALIQLVTATCVFVAALLPTLVTLRELDKQSVWWLQENGWLSPLQDAGGDDALVLGKGKMLHRQKKREELLKTLRVSDWALQQRARANLFGELQASSCDGSAQPVNGKNTSSNFPMRLAAPPETLLVPWVYDAVFADGGTLVNVILVNRDVCAGVDHAAWQRIVQTRLNSSRPSAAAAALAVAGSALVPPLVAGASLDHKLIKSKLLCRFLDHRGSPLQVVESLPIHSLSSVGGPMLVRCPVPFELRSRGRKLSLRLQRIAGSVGVSGGEQGKAQSLMPMTKPFPLCPLPGGFATQKTSRMLSSSSSEQPPSAYLSPPTLAQRRVQAAAAVIEGLRQNDQYAYNISACLALPAGQQRRADLLEWLEFHRLVGVEHFFLFDVRRGGGGGGGGFGGEGDSAAGRAAAAAAAAKSGQAGSAAKAEEEEEADDDADDDSDANAAGQSKLRSLLSSYVDLGLVTLVDWPWAHCSSGFACSHPVEVPFGSGSGVFVQPPKQIDVAQSVCYSRFRSSSRWMLMLEDANEFLGIDTSRRLDGERVSDLASLIAVAEGGHKHLAALEFARHAYVSCPLPAPVLSRAGQGAGAQQQGGNSSAADEQADLGAGLGADQAGSGPESPGHRSDERHRGDEEGGSAPPRLSAYQHSAGELAAAVAGATAATGPRTTVASTTTTTSALLVRTSMVVAADFRVGALLAVETGASSSQWGAGLGARLLKGWAGGWAGGGGLRGNGAAGAGAGAAGAGNFSAGGGGAGAGAQGHQFHERRAEATPARDNRNAQPGEFSVAVVDRRVARVLALFPPWAHNASAAAAVAAGLTPAAGSGGLLQLRCERELLLLQQQVGSGQGGVVGKPKPKDRQTRLAAETAVGAGVCGTAKHEGQFALPWLRVLGDRYTRALNGFVPQGERE